MKQCLSCQEEIGDKFSFCPVCGSALPTAAAPAEPVKYVAETVPAAVPVEHPFVAALESPAVPEPEVIATQPISEPKTTEAFVAGSILSTDAISENGHTDELTDEQLEAVASTTPSYIHDDGEYHLTFMDDSGLISRLAGEIRGVAKQSQLTWPEFKRDPLGFVKRSISGYGQVVSNLVGNRYIAIALSVAVGVFLVLGVGIWASSRFANLIHTLNEKHVGRFTVGQLLVSILGLVAFALIATTLIGWLTRKNTAVVLGGEERDKTAATSGVAVALGIPLILLIATIILIIIPGSRRKLIAMGPNDPDSVDHIVEIPDEQPTPEEGHAGANKGNGGGSNPKPSKPSGGGGGGREEATPANAGQPPPPVDESIRTPPKPPDPPVPNPLLSNPGLDLDKPLAAPITNQPFGVQNSTSTTPSSGPGRGDGMGNGTGPGVGDGEGAGLGPGRGGNTGGGDKGLGSGGPGGGGGVDYNKVFKANDVNQKARIISKPTPEYTEQARVNNTVGTVRLSAVFSSSGQVTSIRPLNQLPYGLTEKAVAAARRIQFTPAMKDGHAVSTYMVIEYNFNIY
jgi:TonB family protein